jgi:hypothetical protein
VQDGLNAVPAPHMRPTLEIRPLWESRSRPRVAGFRVRSAFGRACKLARAPRQQGRGLPGGPAGSGGTAQHSMAYMSSPKKGSMQATSVTAAT